MSSGKFPTKPTSLYRSVIRFSKALEIKPTPKEPGMPPCVNESLKTPEARYSFQPRPALRPMK
jgi:hypothetical protein